MRLSLLVTTCSLVFLLFAGSSVNAKEFTFDYQKIVEVDRTVRLDMNMGRGKVTITGSEDNRLVIEAVKRIRASNYDEAEEVADHIEIKVRASGDNVTVETNYLKMTNRGRSFWQKLLGGGSDAYGDVEYRIAVPTRTDIRLVSLASAIEISSVEGEVEIQNETGTIRGEFLFGPVTISQPDGDVDLQWIEGDVRVNATTGKIAINQVRGALDVATHTGEVHVRTELDSPRDFYVKTTSGAITMLIPETASGELNLETTGGEIETEVPVAIKSVSRNQLVGEFGRGGPRIHLSSASGDVVVQQF